MEIKIYHQIGIFINTYNGLTAKLLLTMAYNDNDETFKEVVNHLLVDEREVLTKLGGIDRVREKYNIAKIASVH